MVVSPNNPNTAPAPQPAQPTLTPEEQALEEIRSQQDATEMYVRSLNTATNPFGHWTEIIVESQTLRKRVRSQCVYEDVLDASGNLIGKALKQLNRSIETW